MFCREIRTLSRFEFVFLVFITENSSMTTSSGLSKPNMYKISRGRTLNGQRIRVRRQLLGLSQEALAKKIGITFQQVQKYERGMNRIGASRLWDMMQVLGVDANYFFIGFYSYGSRLRAYSKYSGRGICPRPDFQHFQILSGTFRHVISRGRCSCRAPCASSGFQLKSPDSVCRS